MEIGLREAKINSFDIGTCEGMKQVAEISEAARHKQIGYDENIAQEVKDIKVELVEQMTKERDKAIEDVRKLLMENKLFIGNQQFFYLFVKIAGNFRKNRL